LGGILFTVLGLLHTYFVFFMSMSAIFEKTFLVAAFLIFLTVVLSSVEYGEELLSL
jgi:hypothetical protein